MKVIKRIEDLKKYVELEFPCEIIEEIEVKLESWHIHEDIALVDLPGLNVDNKNHKELTKKISQELFFVIKFYFYKIRLSYRYFCIIQLLFN